MDFKRSSALGGLNWRSKSGAEYQWSTPISRAQQQTLPTSQAFQSRFPLSARALSLLPFYLCSSLCYFARHLSVPFPPPFFVIFRCSMFLVSYMIFRYLTVFVLFLCVISVVYSFRVPFEHTLLFLFSDKDAKDSKLRHVNWSIWRSEYLHIFERRAMAFGSLIWLKPYTLWIGVSENKLDAR